MAWTTKQLFLIRKIRDTSHVRAVSDQGIKSVIALHHTDFSATNLNLPHAVPGKFFGQTNFRLQRRFIIDSRIKGLH